MEMVMKPACTLAVPNLPTPPLEKVTLMPVGVEVVPGDRTRPLTEAASRQMSGEEGSGGSSDTATCGQASGAGGKHR